MHLIINTKNRGKREHLMGNPLPPKYNASKKKKEERQLLRNRVLHFKDTIESKTSSQNMSW